MNRFVYGYFGISLLILIRYILIFINAIRPDKFAQIQTWTKTNELGVFSYTVILLLAGFVFINLIYPERGWDALHFYFPNGLYFYLTDDIPRDFNVFSFYPTHKPPVSALLLTYNFYINPGFFGQLVPILYIVGLSFLIFRMGEEINLPYRYRLVSIITLLLTPAVYMTILEFAYYQELPVSFYYSSGLVYYYLFTKSKRRYHLLISSLGFGLAILSKISGFSFLIILILTFNLKLKMNDKYFRPAFLLLLGVFIVRKAIIEIYIGTGIFISILIVLTFIQIFHQNRLDLNQLVLLQNRQVLGFLLPLLTLLLIGGTWVYHMSQVPGVIDELANLYLFTEKQGIRWSFGSKTNPLETYTENAQGVSFLVSIFSIFVGSQFSLFLLIPKLLGIRRAYYDYPEINLWLGSFLILWLTFFSTVSIRYLSIIWIPLTLLTVIGFKEIIDYFNLQEIERPLLLLGAGINLLFYYPLIPFEFLSESFHNRIFDYHSSILRLMIYVSVFSLFSWIMLRQLQKYVINHQGEFNNNKRLKTITILIGLILIIAPISFQFVQLASVGFDIDEFQSDWAYDNRATVREVSDYLINQQMPLDAITIVVNFPGLSYFIKRPVIDLLFAIRFLDEDQQTELTNENLTEVYQDFVSRNVNYIVELLEGHVYYDVYIARFQSRYPFLVLNNSTYTQLVFSNSEFGLWELI